MTSGNSLGSPTDVSFRTVLATLSVEDEAEFSAMLAAELPSLRCYDLPNRSEREKEQPPAIELHRSIVDCSTEMIEFCFVADNWQPQWRRSQYNSSWVMMATQAPNGVMHRCGPPSGPRANDARVVYESLSGGEFYFRCRVGVEEDFRIANKVLRMLRRYCTNKLMPVLFPSLKPLGEYKNNNRWVGPHALAWARAAPNRILGLAGRLAYRPLD